MTGTGFCTNAKCPRAERREEIERYPGPGQYCPDCGELLASSPVPPPSAPLPRRNPIRMLTAAAAAIAILVVVTAVIVVPLVPALGVRVCDSSMTAQIANATVETYSRQHRVWPYHYTVTRPGDDACDVRFGAAFSGSGDAVIARDGVVAVVNPQNPIARLEVDQLRGILTGKIVDWSQLGGPRGAIMAVVPEDGSDETDVLIRKVTQGSHFGAHVIRMPAGAPITRFVSSPSGARAIGIVPFSLATPAKVLALGGAPPPSQLSIANERYALTVLLLAQSDFRSPRPPAKALLATARSSSGANGLLGQPALITRSGP